MRQAHRGGGVEGKALLTWIPGVTVGADIVPRHVLYEVVKRLLVARLLAFAERPVHGHGGQAGGRGRRTKGELRVLVAQEPVKSRPRWWEKGRPSRTSGGRQGGRAIDWCQRFLGIPNVALLISPKLLESGSEHRNVLVIGSGRAVARNWLLCGKAGTGWAGGGTLARWHAGWYG